MASRDKLILGAVAALVIGLLVALGQAESSPPSSAPSAAAHDAGERDAGALIEDDSIYNPASPNYDPSLAATPERERGSVPVHGYRRGDGTYVRPHTRHRPGR